jgi:hypothetical protein
LSSYADVDRRSTRQWAEDNGHDAQKLVAKVARLPYACTLAHGCCQQLFCHDISTLLSLDNLWAKRRRPQVLELAELEDAQDLDVCLHG